MRLIHKGLILIAVPLAFEIFFVFGFFNLLQRSTEQLEREAHVKEVIGCVEKLQVLLLEATSIAGLCRVYQEAEYQKRFDEVWQEIGVNYKVLKGLERGKLEQKENLHKLGQALIGFWHLDRLLKESPEIEKYQDVLSSSLGPHNDFPSLILDWCRGQVILSPASWIVAAELKTVMPAYELREQIKRHFLYFLLIGLIGNLMIVIVLALFFVRSIEKRLKNLIGNIILLADRADLRPPLGGTDEIARLDQVLHHAASNLLEIERFKKQLLGIVCHELKAPLSAVQILLSLLSTGGFGELGKKAQLAVEKAEQNSERLQRLVSDLLDLEIVGSQKIRTEFEQTAIEKIMKASVDLVIGFAGSSRVKIEIKSIDGTIYCDSARLVRVLVNLLSNAIKYSPPGSQVILEARQLPDCVELNVVDQGKGIPQELQEAVFEIFQQADTMPETTVKGTGLGLAICKSIVEMHNGSIGVKSSPGCGSTFSVRLPMENKILRDVQVISHDGDPSRQLTATASPLLRLRHKGLLLIGLPFAIQLLLMSILSLQLVQASHEIEQQVYSRELVVVALQTSQSAMNAGLLASIYGGYPEKRIKSAYYDEVTKLNKLVADLNNRASGDAERMKLAKAIEHTVAGVSRVHLGVLERNWKSDSLSKLILDHKMAKRTFDYRRQFTDAIDRLAEHENRLQSRFKCRTLATVQGMDKILVAGLVINLLLATIMTLFLMRNVSKRVKNVMTNAERLLKDEPLLEPLGGNDEIAELDLAFHKTAKAIFEEQQLKKRLLSIASHELQAPLMAMCTTFELLSSGAQGTLPEQAANRVALAEQGTRRLVALINDLLDIENMEAGKFVLNFRDVCLSELVTKAISAVEAAAHKKVLQVENETTAVVIWADPDKLLQVLINLISNAIKFSAEGQKVVVASCQEEGGSLIVQVSDSGIGIAKDMQERIFERFYKAKDMDDNQTGGTGLGLSISKAIVEQHGGRIAVESQLGHGSLFWFSIPARGADGTSADGAAPIAI